MFQDQRRWTASLLIAIVVLVTAAVLMGSAGLVAARDARAAATYTVQAGDSLRAIAAEFGVSEEALAAANGLQPREFLRRGQILTIPDADQAAENAPAEPTAPAEETASPTDAAMTSEETTEPTAESTAASTEASPAEPMVSPDEPAMPPHASTYTVQSGDSLRAIARTFGITVEALAEANGLATTAFLRKGQVLVIPSAEAIGNAMPEPTAAPTAVMEEATPEPSPAATEEVMAEPTAEVTAEVTEEVTEEAASEPTTEATEEATTEATDEPTAEPVEEPTTEATPTPTEEAMTEEPILGDVVEELSATGEFTTLITALQAADLIEMLQGDGPFTVFATDAAFDDLPMGAMNALMIDPAGDLAQILLYHVTPGLITAADVTDGMEAMTLQGGTLTFGVTDGSLMVSGAQVITADLPAANGVIHVIDAVLVPSAPAASAPPTAAERPAVTLPMIAADQDAVAAANAWPAPEDGPELFSPVANAAYHSPIAITGLAQPGAGDLAVSLTGADGALLAERTVAVGEAAAFFRTYVRFDVTEPTEAVLVVGSREVTVTLVPGQRFIDVNSPTVGAVACGTVTVNGYSNTFEANVVLTLTTHDGQPLEQMPTLGGAYGLYRDFDAAFSYTSDETVALLVSAYEVDASGRFVTLDQTVVPVTYYPASSAPCQ